MDFFFIFMFNLVLILAIMIIRRLIGITKMLDEYNRHFLNDEDKKGVRHD